MIPPRIAAYAAGLLLVAAGLAGAYRWAYGNGREAERAVWEKATAEAGERFSEALAAQQATLETTDRDLAAARRQSNRAREGLSDAFTRDPAAADWGRQLVPDSVRNALGDLAMPPDPAGAH